MNESGTSGTFSSKWEADTPKEPKQWDLTRDEQIELHLRWVRRVGAMKLLAELQQLKGEEIAQESAWWEEVMLRCGIPKDHYGRLIASHRLGKIWVRGEVEELDIAEETRARDAIGY